MVDVEFSQDKLYFITPLSSAVENVVKLTNKTTSLVAYKVLCTSQCRYCLVAPVGIIEPADCVSIRIALSLRGFNAENPAPTEGSSDALFFDFCVLPAGSKHFTGAEAAAFWKQRGPVGKKTVFEDGDPCERRRLPCLFTSKENVPPQYRQVSVLREPSERKTPRPSVLSPANASKVPAKKSPPRFLRRLMTFKFSYVVAFLFVMLAFICGALANKSAILSLVE